MKTNNYHHWTMEDDTTLAEEVFKTYVVPVLSKGNPAKTKPLNDFVKVLHQKLPDIIPGSLRMRISNVKAVLSENGTPNSLDIGLLNRYAKLTKKAVDACYEKFGIPMPNVNTKD